MLSLLKKYIYLIEGNSAISHTSLDWGGVGGGGGGVIDIRVMIQKRSTDLQI